MRRRLKYTPPKQNTTFALNINSMTDMFTIMLVFLLQTYSTSPVEIKPENNLRMPSSTTVISPIQAVQIVLSKEGLKFDGNVIAKVEKNDFEAQSLDKNDPSFITPLFTLLNKMAQDAKKEEDKEGRVLIQADREFPYETLRKVMYTASMAGFPKVKLATIPGE